MKNVQVPSRAVVKEALARSFLADIDPAIAQSLTHDAVVYRARAGETFLGQDEEQRCAIMVNGLGRVFLILPDGREKTVRDVQSGAAVGVAALTGLPNAVSVQAVTDSHLLDLDPERLAKLALRDVGLAMAIAREVTRRLHDTYALMAGELGPVRQRLARLLLDRAAETRDDPAVARISHPELALQLGCSREWVAKNLAGLRRDGVLRTERDQIRLLDPVRLHLIANAWQTIDGAEGGRSQSSMEL